MRPHEQRLAELEAQRRQLFGRWGEQLTTMWNRAQACRTQAETIQRLPVQGQVYVVAGWVPTRRLEETIQAVQTGNERPGDHRGAGTRRARPQVPTQLHNPRLLRAFETLVTNFGVPAYDELDPTLVVMLSFLLMYGIMFGDVGHGLLLALAGVVVGHAQGRPGALRSGIDPVRAQRGGVRRAVRRRPGHAAPARALAASGGGRSRRSCCLRWRPAWCC